MENKNSAAVKAAEKQLTVLRYFNAPREVVFKAWTDPERVMRWWGPQGFHTPFCKIELRPGGTFRFCLRSPEGKDLWGKGVYREILKPERLVYENYFSDENGNTVSPSKYGMNPAWPEAALVTVIFEDRAGRTRLTLSLGVTAELAKLQLADRGWNESFDRLAEYLKKSAAK